MLIFELPCLTCLYYHSEKKGAATAATSAAAATAASVDRPAQPASEKSAQPLEPSAAITATMTAQVTPTISTASDDLPPQTMLPDTAGTENEPEKMDSVDSEDASANLGAVAEDKGIRYMVDLYQSYLCTKNVYSFKL